MPEARIVSSIGEIAPALWNACVPHTAEDHACLVAIERAALPGFTLSYIVVEEGGRVLAVAPAFVTAYPLDTMMEGAGARIVGRLRQSLPRLLAPSLACLGSPCTETAGIRFAPHLGAAERREIAPLFLAALGDIGAANRCALLGLKDLAPEEASALSTALAGEHYLPTSGQPVAWLAIEFGTVDEYLGQLSRATRRSLRRKLKSSGTVRVERRTSIDDVAARVFALYGATLDRAANRFEELTPAYFTGLLETMAGRAHCTLYYVGDALLAANVLIEDGDTLLDKYWCMADAGRAHDLYYLSWIANIGYCLDRGLSRYQAGQASPDLKRSLGCRFDATTTYVRHRNPLCHGALRMALPWLAGGEPVARAA